MFWSKNVLKSCFRPKNASNERFEPEIRHFKKTPLDETIEIGNLKMRDAIWDFVMCNRTIHAIDGFWQVPINDTLVRKCTRWGRNVNGTWQNQVWLVKNGQIFFFNLFFNFFSFFVKLFYIFCQNEPFLHFSV